MRPRKQILPVCANEERASVLRFTLQTHAFAVTTVAVAGEALDLAHAQRFNLVLCVWPVDGIEYLLRQMSDMKEDVRTLVLADTLTLAPAGLLASAVLTKGCDMALILERVKLLAVRKYGPRPYMPPAAIAQTEGRAA